MRLNTENSRGTETRREQEVASRQAHSVQQPQARDVPRRQAMRQDGVPTLEGWDIFQVYVDVEYVEFFSLI